MYTRRLKFSFALLAGASIFGCASVDKASVSFSKPGLNIENIAATSEMWYPPTTTRLCASRPVITEARLEKRLTRRGNEPGVAFVVALGANIGATISDTDFPVSDFKDYLLDAARNGAYTNASYTGGPSPIYIQGSVLRQIALAITVLEAIGALTISEREELIDWGDRMLVYQRPGASGAKSNDSIAMIGTAKIAWGLATDNQEVFQDGYDAHLRALPYILNNVGNPGVENFHRNTLTPLEEYNINLQSLVENAAMLHRAGINAFEIESNGKTLHDAVAWMAAILKDRTESLEAFREKWGKFRHFRGSSINYHLGWVPIYLTLFPEKEFAMDLRQVFLKVPYSNTSNFTPKNLGGNPQCIWGFEPS